MIHLFARLSRVTRLFLILALVIALPTLFLLYPSHRVPHSLSDKYDSYEAGGIDGPHWRAEKRPDFEKEEARWHAGEEEDDEGAMCLGDECTVGGTGQSWMGGGGGTSKAKTGGVNGVNGAQDGAEEDVVEGGVIMPKLVNETAKAELGRAAWRVLHLMTLRYPENPTQSDRTALKTYFHLFSRLYPCGECAAEFQALLKQYPPQTSSRKSASMWLCHVHNLVNERLGKPEFDCLTLDATYDCGCGDGEESGQKAATESAGTGQEDLTPPPRPGLQNKILGGKGGLRGGAGQGWKQAAAKPGDRDRGVEENDVLEDRAVALDVPGKQERQAEVLRAIAAKNPRGVTA